MSDVPRFDCFDDGMREGYNERWVRSSDYDALRAKRDALAKDAARYRWLRRNCQYGFEDHDGPQLIHRNGETGPHQNARWREDLDAAIDAEMEKQP